MDKTSLEILKLLSRNPYTKIDINELAEIYSYSSRWIRKYIVDINDYLLSNQLGNISIDRNIINVEFIDINKLYKNIEQIDYYSYKISKNERISLMAFIILNSKNKYNSKYFCNKFYISESTYKRDISDMKKILSNYKLKYEGKVERYSKIIGEEEDKRNYIFDLLKNKTIINSIEEIYEISLISIYQNLRTYIKKLTPKDEDEVLYYIYIQLNRLNIFGKEIVKKDKVLLKNDKYNELKSKIYEIYNINLTDNEVININSRVIKKKQLDDYIRIQIVTKLFIDKISTSLNVTLSRDFLFYENLSNHICSMIEKTINSPMDTILFKNVIEENKNVKKTVRENIGILEKHIGRELSEVEKNYIIIHICAALERIKNIKIKLNIGIYCNLRESAKLFMINILKKYFNFNIYEVDENFKLKNEENKKIDFYISNEVLKTDKNYIYISDDLKDEDYIKIGNEITRILRLQAEEKMYLDPRMSDILCDEILSIIKDEKLEKNIKTTIRKYTKRLIYIDKNELLLSHFLNDEYIYTDVDVKDFKEGIRYGCKILEEKGDILQGYDNRIIENIEQNGSYIVISEGFAFPHASIDMDNINTSMVLLKLKNPVNYIDMKNIKYICILSATDKETHMNAFFDLVKMLKNEMFKYELDKSKNTKEIRNVIRYYEMILREEEE